MPVDENLVRHIEETIADGKWTFTLECGRGTTYAHNRPVLYGHSTYKRGSVLAGRSQRVFLEEWETWEEGREAVAELAKRIRVLNGKKFTDLGPTAEEPACGTTHIPLAVMTAGLPDGPDY